MNHPHTFLRFPGGREKALSFTFDDGTVEDAWLCDVFGKLGLCGTFNLNSGLFHEAGTDYSSLDIDIFPVRDIQYRMTAEEIVGALDRPYIEIAAHGLCHCDPVLMDSASRVWDIMADRHNLEELFHRPVTGYAYPQSSFNDDVVRTVKECGFEYGRTVVCTFDFGIPTDMFRMAPTCGFTYNGLSDLVSKFLSFKTTTGLYYQSTDAAFFNIFGHTYEMNAQEGLKERFETVLEQLAEHDDVWYATNIEVVRYINAFRGLI